MPMNEDDEERIAAHLAKTMAMMCVRNTMIEDIHAGLAPVTRTGDYSDVMVCLTSAPLGQIEVIA